MCRAHPSREWRPPVPKNSSSKWQARRGDGDRCRKQFPVSQLPGSEPNRCTPSWRCRRRRALPGRAAMMLMEEAVSGVGLRLSAAWKMASRGNVLGS